MRLSVAFWALAGNGDILLRHNGHKLWYDSTYADGEAAVLDWIDGLGVDSSPLGFLDGTGGNFRRLTYLLRDLADRFCQFLRGGRDGLNVGLGLFGSSCD